MEKESVPVSTFEDSIKSASPMPLYDQKKGKSAYDYFLALGDFLCESLSSGKSPLLPDKDGFIDLQPAYNINNNTKAEGLTQLMLLSKIAELESPSNGFVTFETVKNAQDAGVECRIIKGSKGVVIPVVEEKDWSEIKFKNTWFNVSQIENAENLIAFCKERMTEQYKKDLQYINEHYPNSDFKEKKNPAEYIMSKPNEKVIPLNEKTEEPYQYLAQVLNAVSSGRKLFVTPEQAENFKSKAITILNAEYEPGKRDVFAIKKMSNAAEHLYKVNKKHLQEYYQKKNNPQQKKIVEKESRSNDASYERGM
ncbi:hypothetical protein [Treponema pectinovorum]|uniref:hypothetical protein n=1 Tax=Treponema pectinovorum TaxID=164 RepID=UPI0011F2B1BE|nr:hypothetical protein [Treponema pectinovorum]